LVSKTREIENLPETEGFFISQENQHGGGSYAAMNKTRTILAKERK